MAALSLAPGGIAGVVISAPEGARAQPGLEGGAFVIADQPTVFYALTVYAGASEPRWQERVKERYKLLDDRSKVLVDTPDLVVFKNSNGGMDFEKVVTVDGKKYGCASWNAISHDEESIARLMLSCSTLRKATSALVEKSLAPAEMPGLVITAPESAGVEKDDFGAAAIRADDVGFAMTVQRLTFDRSLYAHLLRRRATALVETSDLVIYQLKEGGSLGFMKGVTVGADHYVCTNLGGASVDRAAADKMIESCATLQAKK